MSHATQTMNGNTLATEIKPQNYDSPVFRFGVDPMDELKHYTFAIHITAGNFNVINNEIIQDYDEFVIECADFDELIKKGDQLHMSSVTITDKKFMVVADLECEDIKDTYLYYDFDWIGEKIDMLEESY